MQVWGIIIKHADQTILQNLLRAIRKESGLSQQELAARLDKPQSFVSKYESGERRLDILEILQICRTLEVSFAVFAQRLENQLVEAKPLKDLSGLREFMIFRITSKGHDFLDTFRNDTIWSDVKEKASVVGGFTISLLTELGKSYIKSKLGL